MRAVPALGPVERVVAAIGYDHVAHVDRAAEELKAVVRALIGLAVVHGGAVAHAVEGDAVGLVLFVEGKARIFQTDVAQRARVVGVVVAAIGGVANFGAARAAFGVGVGAAADVNAAPGTGLFQFAGHDDGFLGRALCVDLGALLHEDVVHEVVVHGHDAHARLDGERDALLDGQGTAQAVGRALREGEVLRQRAAERLGRGRGRRRDVVIVGAGGEAGRAGGTHTEGQSHRPELSVQRFHHNGIKLGLNDMNC